MPSNVFPSDSDFVLFCDTADEAHLRQWRFVLQTADGQDVLRAEDHEGLMCPLRLELLGLVRGLEALPRPSRVVVATSSRYVRRGVGMAMPTWRKDGWLSESPQSLTAGTVRDGDLWRRVERAMNIHEVSVLPLPGESTLKNVRFDPPELERQPRGRLRPRAIRPHCQNT